MIILQAFPKFIATYKGTVFQTQIFREIVNVRYVEAKERNMPYFRSLQWSWFFMAMTNVCKFFFSLFLLKDSS